MDNILTTPADFKPDFSTLSGKTVLVTGAASEIGRAVAFAAAKSGATVLMLDRKQRPMLPYYDAICELGLAEPMLIEFDLAKADSRAFDNLAAALLATVPEIHGLVHCAMWPAPLTPLVHADMVAWAKVLEQHLVKPVFLTKSLYPGLNHSRPASIIFTTMDIGRIGRAYWGPVGAAFAGVENVCETLGAECPDYRIRVNTLDPGKVKTAIRKQFYPAESIRYLRDASDPRITNTYIYLLSDQSQHRTARRFAVMPLVV